MKKSQTVILVLGLVTVILLGIFMGYLQKQPYVGDFVRIASDLEKGDVVKGSEFGVFMETEKRRRGIRIAYVPPANVFNDKTKRGRDAKKVAEYVYREIEKLNRAAREHNRRLVKEKRADMKPKRELSVWYCRVVMKSGSSGGCRQAEEHAIRFDSLEFQADKFKRGGPGR